MAIIKAERFTALKAKVKAECQRRNGSGSVASYGGADYDYTVAPAAGKTVRKEHRDKLTGPMSAINSDAVPATSGETIIQEDELKNMETRVAVWAARTKTDASGSDCKAGCTGMCYGSCTGGCTGCGSGCPTGCSGCGSGCPTGCSGCGSGCPGGCSGCGSGCSGCSGCGDSCKRACSTNCNTSCVEACGSSSTSGSTCSGCSVFCTSSSKY